jgi:predicted porin
MPQTNKLTLFTALIWERLLNQLLRYMLLIFAFAMTLLLFTREASAQDAHYWTLQYGPKSSLLGGAVIGAADDVSATFYNPGALSLADNLAFAVSTDVFEVSGVTLEGGGGRGVNLGTSRSGLRPSMLAGTITEKLFGKGVLAYSALTRSKGTQDLEGIVALSGEEIPPGIELKDVAGLVRYEGEFSDFWAGLSYSQPLGSFFGLGVTWYGAARSQRRRIESITQGIETGGSGAATIDIRGGRYSTIRTLFKFGAFAKTGPFTGGITLTTPSLHISGSGQLGFNTSTIRPDSASLALNIQTDLPAEFKSPLSIGGGFGWQFGNARLHASAEWYEEITPYFVMQGEDFRAQEPQDALFPVDAVQALDKVFNWAVGLEYTFSKKVHGYASFYTDNSGLTEKIERAGLSTLPIDISSLNLGADVIVGPALLTIGAGYGWGRKADEQLTDLLRQEDEDFQATFVYRNMRVLFGFEIGGR